MAISDRAEARTRGLMHLMAGTPVRDITLVLKGSVYLGPHPLELRTDINGEKFGHNVHSGVRLLTDWRDTKPNENPMMIAIRHLFNGPTPTIRYLRTINDGNAAFFHEIATDQHVFLSGGYGLAAEIAREHRRAIDDVFELVSHNLDIEIDRVTNHNPQRKLRSIIYQAYKEATHPRAA